MRRKQRSEDCKRPSNSSATLMSSRKRMKEDKGLCDYFGNVDIFLITVNP